MRRVAELVAQLAGAGEDRLDLRARPALHHPQRQPADHLEPELVLQPLGAIPHPAQHRQPALGERQRFAKREQPDGVPRPGEEVLRALPEIPGRFAERAEPAGDRGLLTQVVRHERACDAAAERRPACRLQRAIQRVLVEHVDEAVLERQRQVGELVLPGALDEHVHVLERVEPFLDFGRVHLGRLGDDGGVELVPLHARRDEKLPIRLVEPLDLPGDHAADRGRQVAERIFLGPRQHPRRRRGRRGCPSRAGSGRRRP